MVFTSKIALNMVSSIEKFLQYIVIWSLDLHLLVEKQIK